MCGLVIFFILVFVLVVILIYFDEGFIFKGFKGVDYGE